MKTQLLIALALSVFAGIASVNAADNTSQGVTSQRLQNDKFMRPFYTDDTMKTAKTGDDFMAAYKSMSAEDLAMMKQMCASNTSPRDTTCENFNAINQQ